MQTQVEHTSEFSWGGLALNVGIGAVTGAVGGALGSMAGAAIKAGAGALFSQGLKAGLSSAVKAAGQEGMDIVTGKVTGGLLSNAAKSAADSAAQDMADAAESCLMNSFAPVRRSPWPTGRPRRSRTSARAIWFSRPIEVRHRGAARRRGDDHRPRREEPG